MLAKHGLKDKRDVNEVEAPIPAMPAMLNENKVDLIAALAVHRQPQGAGHARTLFTQGDAMGITQLGMWVARKGFIDKNRAALLDFMEDAYGPSVGISIPPTMPKPCRSASR